MSINPILSPLNIAIKSSLQKWLLLVIPHNLAIIIVLSVDFFPLIFKALLIILPALSFRYYYFLHLSQSSKKSVLAIQQDSVKNWFINLKSKSGEPELIGAVLLPSSFISKFLIVLNYKDNQGTNHSVLITRDSCSTNEFRYLVVGIKIANIELK